MKFSFTSCLIGCILFSLSALAQPQPLVILDEAQASQAVYQIYLGKVQPGESFDQFSDVSHLGFLRTFSIEEAPKVQGPSRAAAEQKVFLGPFIGHKTAAKMMDKILEMGYEDAYMERDEKGLQTGKGEALTHSVQLGAFEQLNIKRFNKIETVPAHGVYVKYEDGYFKILSGLYPASEKEYLRKSVIPYMKRVWGFEGFVREVYKDIPPTDNE